MCRMIVTVYTLNKESVAWTKLGALCEMQSKNGTVMGNGAYENNTFAATITGELKMFNHNRNRNFKLPSPTANHNLNCNPSKHLTPNTLTLNFPHRLQTIT